MKKRRGRAKMAINISLSYDLISMLEETLDREEDLSRSELVEKLLWEAFAARRRNTTPQVEAGSLV